MAVAFDAAGGTGGVNVSSLSWSHTVSGSDRYILVGLGCGSAESNPLNGTIAPTVDGIACTLVQTTIINGQRVEVWGYVAPATGSVTVAFNRGANMVFAAGGSMSFTGVDQTSPTGTVVTDTDSSNPGLVTADVVSAVGAMVADFMVQGTEPTRDMLAGAGQTERVDQMPLDNGNGVWLKGSTEAGAATVTMSWANTAGAMSSALIAVPLNAAGASDTTPPTLSSPSASATGPTTGSGSVSTDEGNGTLYSIASTINSAPNVTQIQAGQDGTNAAAADAVSQAVSATGAQPVSFDGLPQGTTIYVWYQHRDAAGNDSAVVSGGSFVTGSVVGRSAPVALNVREAVGRSAAVTTNVRQLATRSAAITLNVRELAGVEAPFALNVREAVGRAAPVALNVREAIGRSAPVTLNVRTLAGRDAVIALNVLAPTGTVTVGRSAAFTLNVRELAGRAAPVTLNVRQLAGRDAPFAVSVRELVGRDASFALNVLGSAPPTVRPGNSFRVPARTRSFRSSP